ncbi:MAG: alpha/beta fold hydrolase [Ilumatobacter sp.]|nr:alpha/beta fold hydrolase [Ilumatobacter sp.]
MSSTDVWSSTAGPDDAPHVVLVHGTLDRSAGLLKLSRRLADRYRVTRYDRRGYGRSVGCEGPYGLEQHLADLVSVIEGASPTVRPRVVFGHSYGGNVALALAERHPELVDGVLTYETPLSWRPWWPGTSAGSDAMAWQADPAMAAERFMRRVIGDARWERLPPSTQAGRRREGTVMVDELLDLRARAPWHGEAIAVPVLAVHGEHGAEHHRDAAEAIAAEVPLGRFETLADARHPGPNTHPDATAALVDDFVRSTVTG